MARWMVREGAIHIILLSRNGREAPEIKSLMQECRRLGALIEVRRCDVSDRASVSSVLDEFAASWPPVRGVIHAAMVLRVRSFPPYVKDIFGNNISNNNHPGCLI